MNNNYMALEKLINSDRFEILYFRGYDAWSQSNDDPHTTYLSYNTGNISEINDNEWGINFELKRDPSPYCISFIFESKGHFLLPSIKIVNEAPHRIEIISEDVLLKVGLEDVLDGINFDVSLIGNVDYYKGVANQFNSILKSLKMKEISK